MYARVKNNLEPSTDSCAVGTAHQLFDCVYNELHLIAQRMMFHERCDHTYSATALVNEAYVRMSRHQAKVLWQTRGHFFAAAAEAMRRILIDRARAKLTAKRKRKREQVELDSLATDCRADSQLLTDELLIDLDILLDKLDDEDSEAAQFLKLRIFAGFSVVEAGKILGLTRYRAYQLWEYCQAWFALRHDL